MTDSNLGYRRSWLSRTLGLLGNKCRENRGSEIVKKKEEKSRSEDEQPRLPDLHNLLDFSPLEIQK